ncbi:uncharacterized protein LOC118424334 [Branchiostoma floridae]|uniref:Peroxisomal carnitine O-octanoyltransferase n=1 Tax=Branchiostoma floridae TaxID=7739 RepID=A0A9J7N1Y8_BRAFL|nr:uncharacterized protein LOC118424334 [Branchiostoma floridae]
MKKAIQVFGEPTWKYQDSLPPLPVPPLKNTLDKYLESVKPFVTAEEYKQTEAVVREFEEGVGQSLHQQLLERAKVKRNWMEEWLMDLKYLQSRHSLPLTSNIVGFVPVMDYMWSAIGVEPADRVPLFLSASLYLWKLLRKEQIPVDKAVLTGRPFCMDQFRSMFSAHRIPGVTMDKIVSQFRTESEGPSPTHITVLCKGRVFKVEVIDLEGEPLTPAELKIQLEGVKQQCENVSEGPHISVLTVGDRTEWAKTRERMVEMDPVNAHNLSVIEKSILVLAFDDAMPKDSGESLHQALVGSGRNRWFDHVNTEVAFKNGLFAGHFEDQVPDRHVPEPEELVFTIDDEIRDAIIHTEETFIKQASDLELICPSFTDYGKKFIRSFQLHPDSYMQTALQLAYFRLHGKPCPAFESATLRQYYHGRTDFVRACNMEVVNWCKAMVDKTVPDEEKKDLLMAALKKHIQLMQEAKNMLALEAPMSLTTVHRTVQDCALQLLEYVASRTGLTEAVRKLQLARQFAASDDELKQLQLKWIPGILQEWLMKKAIQVFRERTWKYQDSLPPLPVPPLKNTLDKYLESDTCTRKNLEDWWMDLTYLQSRHSLPLISNIVGFTPITDHMWSDIGVEPADRVTLILSASLHLWKLLRKEQIPVDKAVLTGRPFCMDQFRSLFSAHRIPGVIIDKIVSHFKTESEGPSPTHITVLCKGRVFKMEVIDLEGEPLTPAELKIQLEGVKKQYENVCEGPHISVLTAGDRTEWAKTREKMVEMDPVNAHNLSVIEKSIFVLAFDDAMPKDSGEALHQALVGSGKNRWFDHVNTEVAFKSGLFAGHFEHTPADGMVPVYIGPIQKDQVPARPVPEPEELIFTIDDEIRDAIIHTEETFIKQASDLELICPSFTDYGKKFIRSFQLHPDSYMQTALQLAYFRLHGKPAPTYETATLRQYYHGRTETVRTCSMEVVNWCKAMVDNTVPVVEKKELMLSALKKHVQLMEEAKNMLGCDRHLFVLQTLAKSAGIPLPSIYKDEAYTKSGGGGNYVLSTSLIGYTPAPGAAAPMVHHGYCILYNIQPDRFVMLPCKANVNLLVWLTNNQLYESLPNVTSVVKQRRPLLAGHVARSREPAGKLLFWTSLRNGLVAQG